MTTEDGIPLVPYSVEHAEDDDPWYTNPIVIRAEKIAAYIPLSAELFMDRGLHGPRHERVDPTGVWSERWRELQVRTTSMSASGAWFPWEVAPPYERADTVKPASFTPFPRLDALEARWRPRVTETRRRLRNAVQALKGSDPYDRDDW